MKAIKWTRRNKLFAVIGGLAVVILAVYGFVQSPPRSGTLFGTAGSNAMTVYRAFPSDSGNASSELEIADVSELILFPFDRHMVYLMKCDGASLPIHTNQALFSLLGTTYGGDGRTDFKIPNLAQRFPANGVTYYIAVEGYFPSGDATPVLKDGDIRYFAYTASSPQEGFPARTTGEIVLAKNVDENASAGRVLPADGRELQIKSHVSLFALVGTAFGGDGKTTFKLPNLSGVKSPIDGAKYYITTGGKFPRFQ